MIGPAGSHYQGGLRESADMMVDFYGVQGFLFHTDRFPVRRTVMGDDVTHPGATDVLNVPKLAEARTYLV